MWRRKFSWIFCLLVLTGGMGCEQEYYPDFQEEDERKTILRHWVLEKYSINDVPQNISSQYLEWDFFENGSVIEMVDLPYARSTNGSNIANGTWRMEANSRIRLEFTNRIPELFIFTILTSRKLTLLKSINQDVHKYQFAAI